jgi:hypothetical protein
MSALGSAWPTGRGKSLRALPQNNCLHCLENDPEVKSQRHILNVEKIVLQLFFSVLHRVAVLIFDLGPARDPRADYVSEFVERDLAT